MAHWPQSLKPIGKYMARAREVEGREPVVAYYCNYYSLKRAIKLRDMSDDSANRFVTGLLEKCEAAKGAIGTDDGDHFEKVQDFALSVFDHADTEDRSGHATKETALTFYAAMCFIEVCSVFGPLSSSLEERLRYSKWKAADITKALREGRRPEPGAPGEAEALEKARVAEGEALEEARAVEAEAAEKALTEKLEAAERTFIEDVTPYEKPHAAEHENQPQPTAYQSNSSPVPSNGSTHSPVLEQPSSPTVPNSSSTTAPPAPPSSEYETDLANRPDEHLPYPRVAPPFPSSDETSPLLPTLTKAESAFQPSNAVPSFDDVIPHVVYPTPSRIYDGEDAEPPAERRLPVPQKPAIAPLQLPDFGAPPAPREQNSLQRQAYRPLPAINAAPAAVEAPVVRAPPTHVVRAPPAQVVRAPPAPVVSAPPEPKPVVVRKADPNYKPSVKQRQEAQRLAKYAASALDFQDLQTAVSNLEKALELLTGLH